MTLKISRFRVVVKIHVSAKFHAAVRELSCSQTNKKTSTETIHFVTMRGQ